MKKPFDVLKFLSKAFWIALTVSLVVVALALVFPAQFQRLSGTLRTYIGTNFDWYYLAFVTMLVVVCFYMIVSPMSKIRLGDPKSKPEYSKFSWLAMLFSAGMGIGLVFYGAAEPLSHFAISAPEAELYSQDALSDALKFSFFHYGIHAWAIYAIVGLSLAYFQFRKKEATLISATLKPLFGAKTSGLLGQIIDSLTIFATVVGVATTLGYGAVQINGGLNQLFDVPFSSTIQLIIIAVATFLFILSALSGLGNGVRILSNFNMILAGLLLFLGLCVGPKVLILDNLVSSIGAYLNDFARMSFRTAPGSTTEQQWIQDWTILYWAWWISWSPFVGVFIARISKGRTIREFLTHVLLIPSGFSFIWFSVFGVLSTNAVTTNKALAQLPFEQILFGVLEEYPLTSLISGLAIILICTFFVTSADSATYVLAMQSEHGNLNPNNKVKVVWGLLLSLIAAVLLLAGGLDALQNVLIIVAFPFSIMLILVVISLIKELQFEQKKMGLYIKADTYPEIDFPFRSYDD